MKRVVQWLLVLLCIAAALWCVYRLRTLLYAVLAASVFAYLAARPFGMLQRRMAKGWALLLVFACTLLAVMLLAVLIVPLVTRQLSDLAAALPAILQRIQQLLDAVNEAFPILPTARLEETITNWMADIALQTAQKSYSAAGWLLLVPILAFYFLRDKKLFLGALIYLLPVALQREVQALWRRIDRSLRQFLRGQVIVSLLVGVVTAVGLALCGIPYAALLGIAVAACNLIPYIGPVLGAVPVVAVALLGGWQQLLAALAVVLAVQQLENLFLSPRIIGSSIRMHPAYVLLGVFAGGTLLGPVGFLVAVPLLVVAKESLAYVLEKRLQNE